MPVLPMGMKRMKKTVKIVFNEDCVITLDKKEEWSIVEEAVLSYLERFKNNCSKKNKKIEEVKDKILML